MPNTRTQQPLASGAFNNHRCDFLKKVFKPIVVPNAENLSWDTYDSLKIGVDRFCSFFKAPLLEHSTMNTPGEAIHELAIQFKELVTKYAPDTNQIALCIPDENEDANASFMLRLNIPLEYTLYIINYSFTYKRDSMGVFLRRFIKTICSNFGINKITESVYLDYFEYLVEDDSCEDEDKAYARDVLTSKDIYDNPTRYLNSGHSEMAQHIIEFNNLPLLSSSEFNEYIPADNDRELYNSLVRFAPLLDQECVIATYGSMYNRPWDNDEELISLDNRIVLAYDFDDPICNSLQEQIEADYNGGINTDEVSIIIDCNTCDSFLFNELKELIEQIFNCITFLCEIS